MSYDPDDFWAGEHWPSDLEELEAEREAERLAGTYVIGRFDDEPALWYRGQDNHNVDSWTIDPREAVTYPTYDAANEQLVWSLDTPTAEVQPLSEALEWVP